MHAVQDIQKSFAIYYQLKEWTLNKKVMKVKGPLIDETEFQVDKNEEQKWKTSKILKISKRIEIKIIKTISYHLKDSEKIINSWQIRNWDPSSEKKIAWQYTEKQQQTKAEKKECERI